ncbi:Chromate transport protein ChrA [hydrothermal vent metagenome]|uniref:Chromate transport protein ChrA n=1 Tax=hydrothermal vent metagenome TaxID=652676 RepID=A0A3B0UC06_9ZZZZ
MSLTAFGGPQVHIAYFLDRFVDKRGYLTEKELLELNALCQILPGPTSTQTITAIGFRIGGPNLAYLTLLFWILPAVAILIFVAIALSTFQHKETILHAIRFIQPMAVGFIAFAAFKITSKVIESKSGILVLILSTLLSLKASSPFLFPVLILIGGLVTAIKYKRQPKIEKNEPLKIKWSNFLLWLAILIIGGGLATFTNWMPIKLFENFYRNGSLIFGGGQVLIPLLYTEFVTLKDYLTSPEFLSGYGLAQAVPGPVFSFSSYIGALSSREMGIGGMIAGGLISAAGIFLPGTLLIFFVIRFWDNLKRYRIIRASLEGITAASSGMVIAAAIILYLPMEHNMLNPVFILSTFALLQFSKIKAPFIIATGVLLGIII